MEVPQGRDSYEVDNTQVTVRICAANRHAGGLIGKGGSIINGLRTDSGASVKIGNASNRRKQSTAKRLITVNGACNNVQYACELIVYKMVDVEADDLSKDYPPIFTASQSELTFLVGQGACGALIGKGGSKIKETREKSGASIKISSDPLPYSDEKTVLITGTKEEVSMAASEIVKQLAHNPKGHTPAQPFDPEQVGGFQDGWGGGFGDTGGGPPGPYGGGGYGGGGRGRGGWTTSVAPAMAAMGAMASALGFGPARGAWGGGRGRGSFNPMMGGQPGGGYGGGRGGRGGGRGAGRGGGSGGWALPASRPSYGGGGRGATGGNW